MSLEKILKDSVFDRGIIDNKTKSINLAKRFVLENEFLDKPCFIGPDGSISYSKLAFFVKKSASALQLKKIEKNTVVILCLNDSRELVILFFSCLAIGLLPVIINPKSPINNFYYILNEFNNSLVFIDEDNKMPIKPKEKINLIRIKRTDDLSAFSDWMPKDSDSTWNNFLEKTESEPAFIQYTSGSTGKPKGVIHSASSILASCENFSRNQLKIAKNDIIYSTSKTFFGYGMGNTLFFPLYSGATAIIDSDWPSMIRVADNIKQFKPTVLFSGPVIFRLLLEDDEFKKNTHLRLIISSGSMLSFSLKKAWLDKFNIVIHDAFGSTETCHAFATTYGYPPRSGSIGKLITGYSGTIADQNGKIMPVGETGVLMLSSKSLSSGYWNDFQNTRAKFSGGWYRTGDLFSQDEEGYLYYYGRDDDKFKVFGRWLVPVEIEKIVNIAFPEAGDVFIVPWLDNTCEYRPVLCLSVSFDEFAIVSKKIANYIIQQVESYKHPYAYLNIKNFPLNSNGKIDRKLLINIAQQEINNTKISYFQGKINYDNT
ncbi:MULTISPECIES: AMP-binding protein [Xenorhabdus]|uniref:AMP-binding protein n=1 Tax=Xenorhabdus TaxID=626 RepID=UPI00064630B2|nr:MULTISPECIES: AMP-binding protein [Xenorhabdus]MBC8946705.1 acyl-CoA synthetase [Xenorhabdus indica]